MSVLLVLNGGALHDPAPSDHPPRALHLLILTLGKYDLIQLPLQVALWGRYRLLRLFLDVLLLLRPSEVEDCLLLNVHGPIQIISLLFLCLFNV
jgi:hypothetical protein